MNRSSAAVSVVAIILLMQGQLSCASDGELERQQWRDGLHAGADASDPRDAGAVVLHHSVRYLVRSAGGNDRSEVQTHRVVKVLSETGFAVASAHFFVHPEGTLVSFEARTLSADGTSTAVDPTTIVSDETKLGATKIGSRSFQYPRVAVGSILELKTTVRLPWTIASVYDEAADSDWPVAHYEVELLLDRRIVPDVFVNNASPKITHDTHAANNLQRIAFHLDDVPKAVRQPWQPSTRELVPWWAFRVVTWKALIGHVGDTTTWGSAMPKGLKRIVLEGKDLDGFKELRAAHRCAGDLTCLTTTALKQLREDVPFSGFAGFFECRPLNVVERGGTANNHEKAVALFKLLRSVGIDAHLAVTTRDIAVDAATDFPAPLWFDHSLVFVATPTPLWIDPSCEACAAGEVPPWVVGKRALWLSKGTSQFGQPTIATSPFLAISGSPVLPSEHRRTSTMSVRADGDVDIVEAEERRGRPAIDVARHEATQTDEEIRANVTKGLRRRDPSVVVVAAPRWTCDRATANCHREVRYTVPALATVVDDGARLQLPPFSLSSPIEDSVESVPPKDRRHDIHIDSDHTFIETLTITPPAGYTLAVESRVTTEHVDEVPSLLKSATTVELVGEQLQLRREHAVFRGRHARARWQQMHDVLATSRGVRVREVALIRTTPTTTTTTATTATTTP